MLLYYNSYVLPIFDNCMNIWGNAADVHIKKLQVLQNRAARVILNVDMNISSEWLCKQLGWMNINERLFYVTNVLMYKVLNDAAPKYLNVFADHNVAYGLRSSQNVIVPFPRTEMFKSSFHYYDAICWNRLPDDVKSSPNITWFKSLLRKFIFS